MLPLLILTIASLQLRDHAIAAIFRRAMTGGNLRAFQSLAESPSSLGDPEWQSVRDFVAQYDCVSISSSSVRRDGETLVVDLAGDATTKNARHQSIAIPSRWYLSMTAGGKVSFADDTRTRLARQLVEAVTRDDMVKVLRSADDWMLPAVARMIARNADTLAPDKALSIGTVLADRARDRRDQSLMAYAECILACPAKRSGNIAGTVALVNDAREITRHTDPDAYALATLTASRLQTDFPTRLALWEEVIAQADLLDDVRPALDATRDRGWNYVERYDLTAATSSYDVAESLAKRIGDREAELKVLHGRAVIAFSSSDSSAPQKFAQVASSAHEFGLASIESVALSALATATSNPERSIDLYQRTLEVAPKSSAEIRGYAHAHLGIVLADNGCFAEAAPHAEAAVDLARATGAYQPHAYWAAAKARRGQGRYEEAMEFARLAALSNDNPLWMTWVIESDLGEMLIECGDVDRGIETLRESVELIEARRVLTASSPVSRAEYLSTRRQIFEALSAALTSRHRFNEALEVADMMKASALLDAVAGRGEPVLLNVEEKKHEEQLNQRIVDLNRQLARAASTEDEEIREHLRTARFELATFREDMDLRHPRPQSPTRANLDSALAAIHGTVVEYVTRSPADPVIAFVIRNGHVTGRQLTRTSRDLAKEVDIFSARIENRSLTFVNPALELYESLIAPIADLLPSSGELTFIPDSFLWRVPFQALRSPEGRYLLEKYTIAYAPSVQMLGYERRSTDHPRKTLLAFGDPWLAEKTHTKAATFRDLHLGALPDAAEEARKIGRLYRQESSTVATGVAASESLLKRVAGDYRIIHLATHGIVDDDSPLYSAVVLSTAKNDPNDGLLEMREVLDLHLNADLVVLSACDTARGKISPGEGVIGLSWAFLSVGCRSTVVSLWRTDSKASAALMIAFHHALAKGKSPAEALRRAEMVLMSDPRYEHPMYWAPFIVVKGAADR